MKAILLLLAVSLSLAASEFPSHIVKTQFVQMRDGTALATDVYLPARDGKPAEGAFPVLVARSPYNKAGERAKAEFFARHGYVLIAQDCRGFFASEGRFEPMVREGRDGFDTIEWAARQPWSNGKVGTLGASYLALVQYAALIERPPHLMAVYAAVGPTNYWAQGAWRGGAPSGGWPIWILNAAASREPDPIRKEQLEAIVQDPRAWMRRPPQSRMSAFRGLDDYGDAYREQYRHPGFDAYWREPGFWPEGHVNRMKDVPALLVSGWYDPFAQATLGMFRALLSDHSSPTRGIVGPWPHAYGNRDCGEAVFPETAKLDERTLQLAWFDQWLKGKAAPASPPLRYFVMGGGPGRMAGKLHPGGEWRKTDSWPPEGARKRKLYLTGDGRLSPDAPLRSGGLSYPFDPLDPTPVRGGRYRNGCIVDLDQGGARKDILRFAGPPLDRELLLAGDIQLELTVTTSAKDADVAARLVDVWPDGYAMPVAEGLLRLSRRHADGHRERVEPGRAYRLRMDLGSTALRLAKGHRLRVDIASGAFPATEINRGTGEPEWSASGNAVAIQTVITGGTAPSMLQVTVLPDAESSGAPGPRGR
ncbi:MAG: CocE/NonD family hydrolase [Bryobacterales bacterium]|nr:CocE/NonD family hydrolase [Bryobacterales bacterium]